MPLPGGVPTGAAGPINQNANGFDAWWAKQGFASRNEAETFLRANLPQGIALELLDFDEVGRRPGGLEAFLSGLPGGAKARMNAAMEARAAEQAKASAAQGQTSIAARLREIGEGLMKAPGPDDQVARGLSQLGGARQDQAMQMRNAGFTAGSRGASGLSALARQNALLPYLAAREQRGMAALQASGQQDLNQQQQDLALAQAQRGWDQQDFAAQQNQGAAIGSAVGGGLGLLGGLVAAPFTGGASLAALPALMSAGSAGGAGLGGMTAGQPTYRPPRMGGRGPVTS